MVGEPIAVLVHAIEARDLKPKRSSGMIDPILSIEVLGETRFTPKLKQDLAPYFNHYFHLENPNVREFQNETLTVSVFDTGTMFRKELIGSFVFELSEIHRQPNHEFFRVWVLLTDSDKNGKNIVRGYLKLSVTVLRQGDIPTQHDEPDEEESDNQEDDLSKMVLLKPKGMDGVDNVLRAKIFKGENLPKMDKIGSVDPFVEVKYGTNKLRTSTVKGNTSPQWYEELQVPVILPSIADNVFVKIFDFDVGAEPELIAQQIISFKEIQSGAAGKTWGTPQWINLYRGKGSQGEATDYSGRVLTSFSVSPAEAKSAVVKASNEPEPPTSTYTINFDLFEIQGVKSMFDIYVVVSIGPYVVSSSKKKHNEKETHGIVEFYENLPDLDAAFPSDTNQVPDIFVYVYEDVPGSDKRVGYLRYTFQQFSKLGAAPKWESLRRHTSSSKDDENFAASIQFKASIGTQKQQRSKIVKPPKKNYQLRAHIYLGSDLPAGDEDALSDPYLVVSLGGVKQKTKTLEHTTYPDWYETVLLDVELAEAYAPDIQLTVYDFDSVSSDEFLGRVVVPLPKLGSPQAMPEPQWYRLSLKEQIQGKGEILASFQLLPAESKSTPVPQLRPRLIDTEIDIGVLGLRELSPFRLLPVANPYIKFSVSGAKQSVSTKAVKGQGGSPNIFENLKLPASLPENGIYIPALLVEVYDKRPIKDVLVGASNIPLSSFAPWVPQNNRTAVKYVDLPPLVADDAFYQAHAVETLPSLPEAPPADHVVISVDQESTGAESDALLGKGKGKGNSMQEIQLNTRREIPTTTVPGTEDEPEPPQAPQLATEVEHNLKKYPFIEVDLRRGTSKGISSGNLLNRPDAVVGKFKGSVSIRPLSGSSKKQDTSSIDVTQVARPRPFVLRVYVETGHNLVPHDENGFSDPYLVLSVGKQEIKDKENVKVKTLQPEYYKLYTFRGTLPEENELKVKLFDKDDIGSDEFVGETKYDLEMLWFSDEWRKQNPKPKEFRTLWSSLSSFPQGKLKMWIELLTPEEAAALAPTPIGPPVKEPFELRIIVWETKNVVPKDKILGKDSSDQFVVTKFLNHAQTQQQTDVHDSVMDGCGKFNWRIIYGDVLLPYDVPRLKIQVFDKDRVGPNDAIAEANLNLKGFFQKGLRNKSAKIGALASVSNVANQTLQITNTNTKDSSTAGPYNSGQWLDLYHPSYDGVQGTICLELELLTREDALQKAAGRGRGEPNQNPFLPEPVRPKREWFSDLFKFLGLDKIKKYLIIAAIVIVVLLILILAIKLA